MADSLQKIGDRELVSGMDVRGIRPLLIKLITLYNALLNFQIRTDTGRNLFTITGGNAVLELNIPASGGTTAVAPSPLDVVVAPTKAQPNRVRVYFGTLGGVTPDGMSAADNVDANNNDLRFYLVPTPALPYVYGKVLINGTTGAFPSAQVYCTDGESPDGTYAYLPIAQVLFTTAGTIGSIVQLADGNQSLQPVFSTDGSTIYPGFASVTA